jgi:hypothetical protein
MRGLAEVFERTGRLPEAVERLRALVDVDPRNTEAKHVLERLLATPAEIPAAIAAEPVPEPAPEFVEPARDQLDSLDFDVVNLSAVESLPAIPEEKSPPPGDEDFAVTSFDVASRSRFPRWSSPGPILWTPGAGSAALSEAEPAAPAPEPGSGSRRLKRCRCSSPTCCEAAPAPEPMLEPVRGRSRKPCAEIAVEPPAEEPAVEERQWP